MSDKRLIWLLNHSRKMAHETLTITPAEAAEAGCAAGTYAVERFAFRGTLPMHMALSLKNNPPELRRDDSCHQTLLIGGQYRSQIQQCEFIHTSYSLMSEG